MTKRVTFILNRPAFRDQILKGDATVAMLEAAMTAASQGDVRTTLTPTRGRVSLGASMADEAASGILSRALGRIRV